MKRIPLLFVVMVLLAGCAPAAAPTKIVTATVQVSTPTEAPRPTDTPRPTNTSVPTRTPRPTKTKMPTVAPTQVPTEKPTIPPTAAPSTAATTQPPQPTPEPTAAPPPPPTEAPPPPPTEVPLPTEVPAPAQVIIAGVYNSGKVEHVIITNNGGGDADLSGWSVSGSRGDERYTYPGGYILPAGQTMRLHSGEGGVNNPPWDIYWTTKNVWNNDGETVYLWDAAGNLVNQYVY